MGITNRTNLGTYFNRGDKPTEAQFSDLIDSAVNKSNDQISSSVDDVSGLVSIDTNGLVDDTFVDVGNFNSSARGDGGVFYWDSTEDKANHDGKTIINPDHQSTIGSTNWYSSTGDGTDDTGSGCWKKKEQYTLDEFDKNAKIHPQQPAGNVSNKLSHFTSSTEAYILSQRDNEKYVRFKMESGVGTSTNSAGAPFGLIRMTETIPINVVYGAKLGISASNGDVTFNAFSFEGQIDKQGFTDTDNSNIDSVAPGTPSGDFGVHNIKNSGYIEYTIDIGQDNPTLFFLGSGTSTTSAQVSVDGNSYKNVDLSLGAGAIRVELEIPAGTGRVIRITNTTADNCYVAGLNILRIDKLGDRDVDAWKYYYVSGDSYTSGNGASDYAIRDSDANQFVGSYHGGETNNMTNWYLDGVNTTINANDFYINKEVRLLQETDIVSKLISFTNHIFGVDGCISLYTSMNGGINASSFYTAMLTSSTDHTQVIFPRYETISGTKFLGNSNFGMQYDTVNVRRLEVSYTLFNVSQNDNKGAYIEDAAPYHKYYYGPTVSGQQYFTEIDFVQHKKFY